MISFFPLEVSDVKLKGERERLRPGKIDTDSRIDGQAGRQADGMT